MKTMANILLPVALLLAAGQAQAGATAGQPPEERKLQARQVPTSGQLLREIRQQELTRTLSDGVTEAHVTEPDQPYEVIDGGIPLPAGLCEIAAQGCQSLVGGKHQ